MRKPNVIVIVTDDQGYCDVACNGNPYILTPNLDAMYEDAIHCEDYHTDPMCAPTRAGLLTGQYSMRVGVWSTLNGRYYLNKESMTMADYFQQDGYATGLFGKWHMGDNYPYRPCDRGFDRVVTFGGGVVGETPDYWDNDYFDDIYEKDGVLKQFNGYCTDVWFDETLEFIEENKNKPFFCYLPTNAPHDPYNVDPKYKIPYLEKGLSERMAGFYGMITNIDDNIGRLEIKLKELELLDNTIIIFMGDNGSSGVVTDENGWVTEGYNGNMRGKKGQVYEGSHKNSCFIRWHNGPLGTPRALHGLTAQIDLLPTLLDCCNIDSKNARFDGVSMYKGLSHGESHINRERVMLIHRMQLDYPEKYRDFTVLTDQYRFIKTKNDGADSIMLFDMKEDFSQKKNIAMNHANMVCDFMKTYDDWWDDVTTNGQYDYSYINIGHDQSEVKLTCHSWHGNDSLAYSQVNIREGIAGSGYWTLEAESEAMYEFELRRWPKEINLALNATIAQIPENERTHDRPQGKVYDICKAMISIDGQNQIVELVGNETHATFCLKLNQGKMRLQTWFVCQNGEFVGAYYVYVRKVENYE